MKKVLLIVSVGCLIIACNSGGDNKAEKKDSIPSIMDSDSTKMPDSSAKMKGPAHGMSPLDTLGRRPRD